VNPDGTTGDPGAPDVTTILPTIAPPPTLYLHCSQPGGCDQQFAYGTDELYGDITQDAFRTGWTEDVGGWRCPQHQRPPVARCSSDACPAVVQTAFADGNGWQQDQHGWMCPDHHPHHLWEAPTEREPLTPDVCAREARKALDAGAHTISDLMIPIEDVYQRVEHLAAIADMWIQLGRTLKDQ